MTKLLLWFHSQEPIADYKGLVALMEGRTLELCATVGLSDSKGPLHTVELYNNTKDFRHIAPKDDVITVDIERTWDPSGKLDTVTDNG